MSNPDNLLPPKATPLERAVHDVTARLGEVQTPIRDIWNPDKCPVEFLPWLAWALSLSAWKSYWPEAIKRQRIKDAIDIQIRKGTAKSVRDVVSSFGSSLALREWFQTQPMGSPHSFDLVLNIGANVPNTAKYQQDIIDEVSRVKPARSYFTLTAGLSATGGLGLYGATRVIKYKRLNFEEA